MFIFLSRRIKSHGVIKDDALAETASAFQMKYSGVKGIWSRCKRAINEPEKYRLNASQKKGSGSNYKWNVAKVTSRVKAVQFHYRKEIQFLSSQTGIHRSTLHCYLKEGILQKSRGAIKPILTDANKATRISYCGSFVNNGGCFKDMLDQVDID